MNGIDIKQVFKFLQNIPPKFLHFSSEFPLSYFWSVKMEEMEDAGNPALSHFKRPRLLALPSIGIS